MQERAQERHDILNFIRDLDGDLEAWEVKRAIINFIADRDLSEIA